MTRRAADHRARTDRLALDHITTLLRAPEWSGADWLEAIAEIVTGTGRSIEHPEDCSGCGLGLGGWYGEGCSQRDDADDDEDDAPIRFRVKYEDADGEEPIPHDAFTTIITRGRQVNCVGGLCVV